ncbi:MAG: T9SS type A sorting domain-containing protein [Sphingobacteriales bacterium]|nr:MAG: T9SS type A sorting domain-containing protein [Sphingobacteriales bacterium]
MPCDEMLNDELLTLGTYSNYTVPDPTPNPGHGGYLGGTNAYQHKATANKYVSSAVRNVYGANAIIGKASSNTPGTNTMVVFKVWDDNGANGTPGTVLGTATMRLDSIIANLTATGAQFTQVVFNPAIQVTGDFFVGMEMPSTAGDTVAFGLTPHSTTSLVTNPGYHQLPDGTWEAYSEAWTFGGVPSNISNFMLVDTDFELTAAFTPATTNLDLDAGTNTINFHNDSEGGIENAWSVSPNTGVSPQTSVATHPTFAFTLPGTYTVTLIHGNSSINGCEEIVDQTVTVTGTWVGISEELANSVNVYPNPATSQINVEMPGLAASAITVSNAIGQVVKKQVINASEKTVVDVANLGTGIYYVQIETAKGTVTKKVSVQK